MTDGYDPDGCNLDGCNPDRDGQDGGSADLGVNCSTASRRDGTVTEFQFRTPDEVNLLARWLGGLCPDPSEAEGGLAELMLNAVEHGNLGIDYTEKKNLVQAGHFEAEVARRLALPANAERFAEIRVRRHAGGIDFVIRDRGEGFDWSRYLDFDPSRLADPTGRGIAMARQLVFSELEYRGCGNEVRASLYFDTMAAA
ncbi:MAG: hypothetical protein GC191_09715 [Azospirillum sp.]|nr:hypothetical protein [Azospirillum sp.]